jgi:NAD(P)-dependent dehydrogenase (short-subunit alcohol dehydrogenase family)
MAQIYVIGASRGIGLELARQHAQAGDQVFAFARDDQQAPQLAALADVTSASLHKMDMAKDISVAEGAADSGTDTVDILYIVGGIVGKTEPMLESGDWDTFDDAIEIMLKGPLRVILAFLPRLEDGSKVIVFSSQLAASTWPYGGFYPYVAAKSGLNRMIRSMAIDLKDRGIILGLVHPGYVQTDMGGPGAEITPIQSAEGIRKLAQGWTLDKSGDFYKWNGEPHAW